MRPLTTLSLIVALLTGCASMDVANHSPSLPIRFYSEQYDLTFYLPASWQGYSVSVQQLDDERYSAVEDRQLIVGHTAMFTLQHPQSQDGTPYQDIPILAFTSKQWDALHHGELWPSAFAGGTFYELYHNRHFVFAISSRYNARDDVTGQKEVADIIELNRTANKMSHLYLE